MLANSFAFTIRVGGQQDSVCVFRGSLEFFDDLFFGLELFVNRLEVIVDIHAQLAFRQILHMPE
jgi:hypothetical protein